MSMADHREMSWTNEYAFPKAVGLDCLQTVGTSLLPLTDLDRELKSGSASSPENSAGRTII